MAAAPTRRQLEMAEVEEILALDIPAHLATIGPDGFPRITPIWFLWREGCFYMTSTEGVPHVKNLLERPQAAICVDIEEGKPDSEGMRANRSVRAHGNASVTPDERGHYTRLITRKYVPGEAGERRAHMRAAVPRLLIELRPARVLASASA